jgi:hypothetical protein
VGVCGRLVEFLCEFAGVGGSDPLVDGQGLGQDLACLAGVAVQGVAPAEAFQGTGLLKLGGDAGRDVQGFLIIGPRLGRAGGAAEYAGDVVEGFGFAGAIVQVPVELQRGCGWPGQPGGRPCGTGWCPGW